MLSSSLLCSGSSWEHPPFWPRVLLNGIMVSKQRSQLRNSVTLDRTLVRSGEPWGLERTRVLESGRLSSCDWGLSFLIYKVGRMIPSSQSSEEAPGLAHGRSSPKFPSFFLSWSLCIEASVPHKHTMQEHCVGAGERSQTSQ